jgi:hypothetical protein
MNSFRVGVKGMSFLLAILCGSCFPSQSLAVLSLAVSPPQINLGNLKLGESVPKKILVVNPTQKRLKVSVGLKDLSVDEKGGLRPVEDAAGRWSLKRWMVLDKESFWLDPGEKNEVGLTVMVPEDAEAGGHYAGVYFLTSPSEGQVKVAVQVGVIVSGVVEGEVIRQGKLLSFKPQSLVFFGTPPKFTFQVANQGNVHLKLQGNLMIRNWRGDELTVLTLPSGSVFPQTVRSYEQEWPDHPPWGIFKADVKVAGIGKTDQGAGVRFFIIPRMVLVSFPLILLLLAVRYWRKIFPGFLLLLLFLASPFKASAVNGSVPVRVEIHQPIGSTATGLSELENSAASDQSTFFAETEMNQESPEVLGTWDEAGDGTSDEEAPNRENLAPVLSRFGLGLSLLGVLGLVVWGISWLQSKFRS